MLFQKSARFPSQTRIGLAAKVRKADMPRPEIDELVDLRGIHREHEGAELRIGWDEMQY